MEDNPRKLRRGVREGRHEDLKNNTRSVNEQCCGQLGLVSMGTSERLTGICLRVFHPGNKEAGTAPHLCPSWFEMDLNSLLPLVCCVHWLNTLLWPKSSSRESGACSKKSSLRSRVSPDGNNEHPGDWGGINTQYQSFPFMYPFLVVVRMFQALAAKRQDDGRFLFRL